MCKARALRKAYFNLLRGRPVRDIVQQVTPYIFAKKWQITSAAIMTPFVSNTLKMSSENTFHNSLAFICLLNIR